MQEMLFRERERLALDHLADELEDEEIGLHEEREE